jgi:hypothetical protein
MTPIRHGRQVGPVLVVTPMAFNREICPTTVAMLSPRSNRRTPERSRRNDRNVIRRNGCRNTWPHRVGTTIKDI